MKKEDFVSTFVMTTVSILMLVGVTIAWYTAVYAHPTVTGMNMEAEETGSIKIALEAGGDDIAELAEVDRYVEIGLEDLLNIETNQMAPGAYGEVNFYVTSLNQKITSCQVVPTLNPGYEADFEAGYTGGVPDDASIVVNGVEKTISEVLEDHFDFYSDEAMTQPVSLTEPMEVTLIDESDETLKWDTENNIGQEVAVTIYWKWHYEYPFTETELTDMTDAQEEAAIYQYDMEDTWIGTHLETMSFHFDFLATENTQTSQE